METRTTVNDLIFELEKIKNKNVTIVSIGTMAGSDKDCNYVIHLSDGSEVKV